MFKRLSKVLGVLVAFVILAGTASPAFAAPPAPEPTIVDIALSDPDNFSILVAALQAADPAILEALSSRGQYTVFAPTNAAFADLLEELDVSAGELLSNTELLNQVLLYHVIRGRRFSNSIVNARQLKTLEGGFLYPEGATLTDNNGRVANIVALNIEASNGVIHVIDRVVLP